MDDERRRILEESRAREKAQTIFYRRLAAAAATAGRDDAVERLNELHADEQHHLSRLTALLLEAGESPDDLAGVGCPETQLDGWEAEARAREDDEIAWYEELLEGDDLDEDAREVIVEVLSSERHHRDELGGKWMSASR